MEGTSQRGRQPARHRWLTLAVAVAVTVTGAIVASASADFHPGPNSPIAVGSSPVAATTADFDLDGNPDIAVANQGSDTINVLFGDGTGGFPTVTGIGVGTTGPDALATDDFDLDGFPDLAVANVGSDNVTVFFGGLTPFATHTTVAAGSAPAGVTTGDFNLDGFTDLAVADSGASQVTLLFGDGTGAFPSSATVPVGNDPTGIASGDFNNDGNLDLAVCNTADDTVTILLGDGTGAFPTTSTIGVTDPRAVTAAFFDADANLDLAVADGTDNLVQVLLGDGTGAFPTGSTVPTGAEPVSVVATDLGNDGNVDLVTANHTDDNLTVALGDGSGAFTEATYSPVSSGPETSAVTAGDWNGDGDADLAATSATDGDVWTFLSGGTSADADLAGLTTNAGALSPAFAPATTSYTAGPVPFSTASVTVTPTADDAGATIDLSVNGGGFAPTPSGSPSGALPLSVGVNTIDLRVTASDTVTTKTYRITVRRLGTSSNTKLSALSTSAGPLSRPFSPGTTSYKVTTCATTPTATVSATAADSGASLQFRVSTGSYGAPAASPATSAPLPLATGKNSLQVKVTAANGKSTKTYSIAVTGCTTASNADLGSLTTTAGALQPSFSSSHLTYTAGPVSSSTSSVTVTPTAAAPGATIQVRVNGGAFGAVASGSPSGPLALVSGTNTIDVQVTSADTSATKTYTLTVKRNGGGTINGPLACSSAYTGVTVNGPVTVAGGDTCTMTGGTVNGPVLVSAGGTFSGSGGISIAGGLQATGALSVTLDRASVNGVQLTGGTAESSICRSTIVGAVQLSGNTAGISVGDNPPCSGGNTIVGGLIAMNNAALLRISSNAITGPLLCLGNTPDPTGSGNTATVKIAQCSSL